MSDTPSDDQNPTGETPDLFAEPEAPEATDVPEAAPEDRPLRARLADRVANTSGPVRWVGGIALAAVLVLGIGAAGFALGSEGGGHGHGGGRDGSSHGEDRRGGSEGKGGREDGGRGGHGDGRHGDDGDTSSDSRSDDDADSTPSDDATPSSGATAGQ